MTLSTINYNPTLMETDFPIMPETEGAMFFPTLCREHDTLGRRFIMTLVLQSDQDKLDKDGQTFKPVTATLDLDFSKRNDMQSNFARRNWKALLNTETPPMPDPEKEILASDLHEFLLKHAPFNLSCVHNTLKDGRKFANLRPAVQH